MFYRYVPPRKSISIARVDVQFFVERGMRESQCGEVFRAAICPRCQKTFYVCRHCDRGHVYCCRECSIESRCEKCRIYRRHYRRSPEGKKDHRDHERARRRRRILGKEIVGDHSYEEWSVSARVSTRVRMSAAVAVISGTFEEETKDGYVYCEMCGRRGKFVYFGNGTRYQRNRMRVFRYSD